MSIKKIACKKEEFFEILESVCHDLQINLTIDKENENYSQYSILKDNKKSKLRIYNTKVGLTFDTSAGRDKELNSEIEEEIKLLVNRTEHSDFTYKNISSGNIKEIYEQLCGLESTDIVLNNKQNNDPNKSHFFEIKDIATKECITISIYKTGTITISGVKWLLWEEVCEIIEINDDKTSVNKIMDRILLKDNEQIVNEGYSKEENNVKKLISPEVYNFLNRNFRDYLISAECILMNDVKMKEYSTVLCPVAKVLEGYLKQLLIELNLESKLAIKKDWTFGKIFTKDGIKSFDGGEITNKQEEQLKKLYELVKEFRHDIQHGSLNPNLVIRYKSICINKYKEILVAIKDSYFSIFE